MAIIISIILAIISFYVINVVYKNYMKPKSIPTQKPVIPPVITPVIQPVVTPTPVIQPVAPPKPIIQPVAPPKPIIQPIIQPVIPPGDFSISIGVPQSVLDKRNNKQTPSIPEKGLPVKDYTLTDEQIKTIEMNYNPIPMPRGEGLPPGFLDQIKNSPQPTLATTSPSVSPVNWDTVTMPITNPTQVDQVINNQNTMAQDIALTNLEPQYVPMMIPPVVTPMLATTSPDVSPTNWDTLPTITNITNIQPVSPEPVISTIPTIPTIVTDQPVQTVATPVTTPVVLPPPFLCERTKRSYNQGARCQGNDKAKTVKECCTPAGIAKKNIWKPKD